ncbi:uncharacterized protein DUF4232 [Halopolyspora algeriensis]|uniref:Uncharacterized protein DUF4232 n=1 Tax=Halopolyspora algeriensis TaxID=1500506 RepID=A0A368VT78_9ACTN|nr:DUF4232 domain-containing protein [Halopolyspora algeriensis]RCW43657.1 uncharacterized protein DUF4232 [Halopolyspora algeriensis]TQM47560.1 uncharacterized protein DUF4232 [Halopolyspora algeriensis]
MVAGTLDTAMRVAIRASAVLVVGALLAGCGQQTQQAPRAQQANNPVPSARTVPTPPGTSMPGTREGSVAGTPSSPPLSPPPTRTPSPHANSGLVPAGAAQQPPVTERCHTSMLAGNLRRENPAAGQRYAELVLRNSSARTCTVHGYPGLLLVGSDGRPLPTDVSRMPDTDPEPVRLAPGESAVATLHWGVVPAGNEPVDGPCGPEPAELEVIPPDERDPLATPWALGPVCAGGSLDVTAFH